MQGMAGTMALITKDAENLIYRPDWNEPDGV